MLQEEIIERSPFVNIKLSFKEPSVLPQTIPLEIVQKMLSSAYRLLDSIRLTQYRREVIIRDIAVMELLFATGVRVFEICNIRISDINFANRYVKFYGKGSRERIV